MLEVELNIVASDVRGHRDDRCAIKLADEMTSGYTIEIRHDDIHQNEIILRARLHFVDGFQAVELRSTLKVSPRFQADSDDSPASRLETHSGVYDTIKRIEEFAADLPTRRIILNQENMRAAHPARVDVCRLLTVAVVLESSRIVRIRVGLGRHGIRHIVDMFAVHWIDPVGGPHRIDHLFQVTPHLRIRHGGGIGRCGGRGARHGYHGGPPRSIHGRRSRRGCGRLGGIIGGRVHCRHVELHFRIHVAEQLGRLL